MIRTSQTAPDRRLPPGVAAATRRDLFGTMGAFLLLTAAEAGPAKATELDGELLACCAEWNEIEEGDDRLWDVAGNLPGSHSAYIAWHDYIGATRLRWHELVRRICDLPARTPEGLQAKAAVACSAVPQERRDNPDPIDRLGASVFRDVLGRAGA